MKPDVRLEIAGTQYGGWKRIRIARSIEQISGAFDLSVSELWPGQDYERRILAGDACKVKVDGTTVITGYVDEVSIAHGSTKHEVSISGRDVTGDLVDCSAIKGSGQWVNRVILPRSRCFLQKIVVTT